jgi:putative inorganic carbon (HCO3(-)) transporter
VWATGWLADHEVWPALLGVALATFTVQWAPWGLGLLGLLCLNRWLARGAPSVRTPSDGPALWLLALAPLSLWVTVDRGLTLAAISRLLAGLALAYTLVNWATDRRRLYLLAPALAGLGALLGVLWLVGVDPSSGNLASSLDPGPRRAFASVIAVLPLVGAVNPNVIAGGLAMTLPFALAPLLEPWHDRSATVVGPPGLRWAWYSLTGCTSAVVLVLTRSRGAWAATAVAIWLILVYRWRPLIWLAPVGAPVLAWVAWRPVQALVSEGLAGEMGRYELWSRAIYVIQDLPFTGAGAGAFERILDSQFPFFLHGSWVEHAHNLLLQVAVDLGVPGLVAFLALLLVTLWCAVDAARCYRRSGQRTLGALSWSGLASLVAMLVHGLVDAPTWIVGRSAYFPWALIGVLPWAVIGAILASHRHAHAMDAQGAHSLEAQ